MLSNGNLKGNKFLDFEELKNYKKTDLRNSKYLIRKLYYAIENGLLNSEKEAVNKTIRIILQEANLELKVYFAKVFAASNNLTNDLAIILSYEACEIALPILKYSPVLTKENLKKMIPEFTDINKLIAIASRSNIGTEVTDLLICLQNKDIVIQILQNYSAEISDKGFVNLINNFFSHEQILELIKLRIKNSSVDISLVLKDADEIAGQKIIEFFSFNGLLKNEQDSCSISINEDMLNYKELQSIKDEIDVLYKSRKLNNAIILRYLTEGNIIIFLYCVSKIAGFSENYIKYVFYNELDSDEFIAIYRSSSLPKELFKVIRRVFKILANNPGTINSKNFKNKIVIELKNNFSSDVEYFLKLLENS